MPLMEILVDGTSVTTMRAMFHHARAFNGDLSRWDTSKVTNMWNMFEGCPIETNHKPPRCG
jgi:surface protein